MSRIWKSVKDELPPRGNYVLLKVNAKKNPWAWWSHNRVIGFLDMGNKRWFLHAPGNPRIWHVTHWTEIPQFDGEVSGAGANGRGKR